MRSATFRTAYEVTLTDRDGVAHLVCYADGTPSRNRLARVTRNRWANIETVSGHVTQFNVAQTGAPGQLMANGCTIQYSGRTKREAKASPLHYLSV